MCWKLILSVQFSSVFVFGKLMHP